MLVRWNLRVCVCVCVCVCVRACVRACVCVCAKPGVMPSQESCLLGLRKTLKFGPTRLIYQTPV